MFKLFLIVYGMSSSGYLIDIKPPIETQSMQACQSLKDFYTSALPTDNKLKIKAYCLDDGEDLPADSDKQDDSDSK